MKKIIIVKILCIALFINAQAQKKTATDKAVETSEKINNKSREISDASNKVADQARQAGDNAKNIASNLKAVLKVFEPILKLHFKKRNKNKPADNEVVVNTGQVKSDNNNSTSAPPPPPENNNANSGTDANNDDNSRSAKPPPQQNSYDPGVPENTNYNSDGTANWGNHHNPQYGCYIDALTGTILDGGSAEDKPESVDLIFIAPNDGQNAYYLMTPNFAHDNVSANAMWGSNSTDNPVKSWKSVNESEVAETKLTGAQFEKIQYNEQLRGAVKSTRNFSAFYTSLNKLDGKVFAVKTTMGERDAFALIYVVKHIGTSGSGGYLKVKIKCTGFDNNGDGNPDGAIYQARQ
jgi:hypothetical protein